MTTTVVYSDTTDGYIDSDGTYAQAYAGTGSLAAVTTGTSLITGQTKISSTYFVYEAFLQFNTSAVGSDTVSAAILDLYGKENQSATDLTVEVRLYDWGAALATADFVAGSVLGNYTLLAHYATSGGWPTNAYTTFVDDAFAANINGAGQTLIFTSSDRTRSNTTPTGAEYVNARSADQTGTTQDPKITITHAASGGAPVPPVQAVVIW